MKLSEPAGRVEYLGFIKGGHGFTIIPTALFRFRKELGLDRNGLAVLLSVMSHARPGSPDYCEAAYSVVVADTGLHRTVVCAWLRQLLAPLGSDVVIRKRKKRPGGKTSTEAVTVKGVGLLELAARPAKPRHSRQPRFTWREGAPKRDTNVYFLGPLADRLYALLRPKVDAERQGSRFGKPRYDIEFEPERNPDSADWVVDPAAPSARPAARFGKPLYEAEPEEREPTAEDEAEGDVTQGDVDGRAERVTAFVRPDGRIAVNWNE